ncbi:MAG: LamG-like jellyroll fold domain-containing protein, partial [Chthoniobacteraceae bacterium]
DRNGVANGAIVMPGSASLELIAAAFPTDANQALGLRSGSGGSPFTLTAWVYANTLGAASGYNVIFGNTGTGVGTLHAGFATNRAHLGFDQNDATGAAATLDQGKWYHLAFVYDGTSQRVYVNGIPEITRVATNTLKASNLLIGNWNTATHGSNDLIGRLDEVAVFASALNIGQIQALYRGVAANALTPDYSAPRLPGPLGAPGFWGVREVKTYTNIAYNSLVNADRVFNTYAVTPGGIVTNYNAPVINHTDPQSSGATGYFPNEATFGSNTGGNDDNFAMLAKGTIRIAVEDDYTFGFRGDEGSRLRIEGATFTGGTAIGPGNLANPVAQGDAIYFTSATTDSASLGVTHLTPGDYNIEFTYWEQTGTASCEVFAARGAKTLVDASFQLIGNTAAGGLEMVRDLDSYPRVLSFTGNGSTAVVVNGGVPATITLAWQANSVATGATISPDIGAVPTNGSQVIPAPTQTTTYTFTATAGADSSTATLTVYVDSPPIITSLLANPTNVVIGSGVTLGWSTVGATSLLLQPGNIDVTGLTSRVVTPSANTTYTLFATNSFGTVQQSVNVATGTAPVINSFVVSDPNPLYGAETSLSWNITGADSLSINQGVGTVSGAIGSASISTLQTTTYTITASNIYGTVTANATFTISTPIGVTAAGFSARKVVSSVPFPYPGKGYLESAVSLVGGLNVQSQITQNGYTTVNFTNNINDGDFTASNQSFPGGALGNNTAVIITATFVVNTPGEYTFVVNSDDGARLRIDGVDVISDDSTHSPGANSGRVTLSKQSAQLELIYYNVADGGEVELAWIRPNLTWQLLGIVTPAPTIVRGQVLISEFMANNESTLLDEDGNASDWVEIWNSTNATVNLSGYFLTDSLGTPAKWALPGWTLAPNKYLIVFASGKYRYPAQAVAGQDNPGTLAQPHLHTDFGLSKSGGYLALTKSDGAGGYTTLTSFSGYGAQRKDISYGSSDSEGYIGFIDAPTPGGLNAATVGGFVSGVTFDHLRGRYSAPFSLVLSTATPGATIRYTLNGSTPGLNNGTLYTGPIGISSSKGVRAIALKPGWRSSSTDTHSYLFVDDIVTQTIGTATALGFPTNSPNGQTFKYGMSLTNVTSGGGTLQSLKNALAALPTVCMSTDVANLVDVTTGIYVNPGRHGLFWERPVSMEYINAAGTSEFGINCGARIRGGFSRSTGNPKHAFHMYFRSSLYDGKLNYRIFGNSGASEFSQIDLRCEQNYSWSFGNDAKNLLAREEWARITQGDMGQPYARNGYFHLYLNGVYWGIYNFEERTEAAFGETYLGGIKENFYVVKSAGSSGGYNTEMTDGNFAAWYSLVVQALALKNDATEAGRTTKYMKMRGLNADGTPNATYPV